MKDAYFVSLGEKRQKQLQGKYSDADRNRIGTEVQRSLVAKGIKAVVTVEGEGSFPLQITGPKIDADFVREHDAEIETWHVDLDDLDHPIKER